MDLKDSLYSSIVISVNTKEFLASYPFKTFAARTQLVGSNMCMSRDRYNMHMSPEKEETE